jgi:hypothetical protein
MDIITVKKVQVTKKIIKTIKKTNIKSPINDVVL